MDKIYDKETFDMFIKNLECVKSLKGAGVKLIQEGVEDLRKQVVSLERENYQLKLALDNPNRLSELTNEYNNLLKENFYLKQNQGLDLEQKYQVLQEKYKAISKGLQKVTLKRNKWKKRYETEHRRKQELNSELKECQKVADTNSELADYYFAKINKARDYIQNEIFTLSEHDLNYLLDILEE